MDLLLIFKEVTFGAIGIQETVSFFSGWGAVAWYSVAFTIGGDSMDPKISATIAAKSCLFMGFSFSKILYRSTRVFTTTGRAPPIGEPLSR